LSPTIQAIKYFALIFSLLLFVVKNLDIFSFNSDVHSINTRQVSNLHLPANKLTKVQKGVNYSRVRIFNNLPQSIRDLSSDIDIDIYLSFHNILTWQVPVDIELVNMSTQKNIITAQTTKLCNVNKQTNMCGTNSEQ
jgi:hypothetical protein